ncbi:MAG TPA: hypothetical protein VGN17_26180 [Bryobacteraceae bacterium]|jgi:hypothetical protein
MANLSSALLKSIARQRAARVAELLSMAIATDGALATQEIMEAQRATADAWRMAGNISEAKKWDWAAGETARQLRKHVATADPRELEALKGLV